MIFRPFRRRFYPAIPLFSRLCSGSCFFADHAAQSPTPQASAATELQSRLQAASAAQQAGDPDAIAAANKRVIALGLKEMGDLRNLVGAYPAAIELYKRSLELEPTDGTRYSLALAYFRASRPDEGLKESEILVKADPKNAVYWNLQGKLWMLKKDYRQAVDSLSKSLDLQPDMEVAYSMATALLQLHEKDKAATVFTQMERVVGKQGRGPRHGWTRVRTGWLSRRCRGRVQEGHCAERERIARPLLSGIVLPDEEWLGGDAAVAHRSFWLRSSRIPPTFSATTSWGISPRMRRTMRSRIAT